MHCTDNLHLLQDVPFSLSSEAFLSCFLESMGFCGVKATVTLNSGYSCNHGLFSHFWPQEGQTVGAATFEQHRAALRHRDGRTDRPSLLQTMKHHLWKICLSSNCKNLCEVQDDTGFGSVVAAMLSKEKHLGMEIFLEWFCKQRKKKEIK